MSHRPGRIPEDFPPEIRRLVVAACGRFEEAWRGGARPAIAPYLDGLGPTERVFVLHELIALEIALRAGEGDPPTPEAATDRSPDDAQDLTTTLAPPNGATHTSARGISSGPPTEDMEPLSTAPDGAEPTEMGRVRGGGRGSVPRRLGRYRVIRLLGQGSSGSVYLARDGDLDRDVAIKVPMARSLAQPGRLEALLAEARLAASLRHPAIVGVYDVGRDDDGSVFIVLEYVEGMTLGDLLQRGRIEPVRLVDFLISVADAIQHAHGAGLVHRDLKPSNIMIDEQGRPRVADFGLAVTEAAQHDKAGEVAGTPTHMAPEQVRGEVHLLDGRTDVWALGVILYQGLTGCLPFIGHNRAALFGGILRSEPSPPRQIDDAIPRELERICLKCLSKRMADRHGSASDLAEDLRAWLDAVRSPAVAASRAKDGSRLDAEVATRIVPRGLRAFGSEDADYFLDLLPGPRDRNGLPESIRFWKARIEERDADATFRVGLLYGPSGCGKSSLAGAGLLPRLAEGIVAVCVDASPDQTGPRIMQALRKRLPGIPDGQGLVETFASLRRGDGPKVVVVLDQFEQWLHAHGGAPESELSDALRQCDGGRLQAVVMVRDDFGMAAARFLDALDVPIVQGHNFATLDLFDVDHARHVLTRFGQAFGKLPAGPPGPSADQRRFLDLVTSGLARDGKVVPVRLALFAEMVKGKPWVPSTLEEAGGTEGIGVNFLEETFSSRSANPRHRIHERPARNVLKALLPGVGADIKGQTRSYAELREASGLSDRPGAFADLLRILDGELRLITPIDHPESGPGPKDDPSSKWWQLTHDYLVPTLKTWLTRRQKETRRGRAELRLEDRATLWSARPERRHLPSLFEWIGIRVLTDATRWSAPQRAMMRRAGRLHGCRLAVACTLLASLLVGALVIRANSERIRSQARADGLVDQLLVADVAGLPGVVASLERVPSLVTPRLEAVAGAPRRPRGDRLRATYALAARPGVAASRLIEFAPSSDLRELAAIRDRLAPYAPALRDELWAASDRGPSTPASRLRIGALLAVADAGGDRWRDLALPVTNALLAETLDLDAWLSLLRPAARALKPHLLERFFDATATPTERVNAASVLARYADTALFTELLLKAEAPQFTTLFPAATGHGEAIVEAARKALTRGDERPAADDGPALDRRARNAAIALLRLGRAGDVEALLSISDNPTVRTMVILEMHDFGIPPEQVLDVLQGWDDPTARQALLLALEPYRARELSPATSRSLSDLLARQIRDGRHQADRGAAEWLLRRRGRDALLAEPSRDRRREAPPDAAPPRDRDWWITPHGHTMTAVPAPADSGLRLIALGTHEVTMHQYREFRRDADFDVLHHPGDERGPANKVTFVDAMRYCRWLSEEEGVPEDQMCYPPLDRIVEGDATLSEGRRMRTGYRLPTEDEWELAARAGSSTRWFFGDVEEHVRHFAWYAVNSGDRLHRVGMLRPNPLGLFDILGNTSEWCHPAATTVLEVGKYVLRGGCYNYPPSDVESSASYHQSKAGYSFNGFRLARTIATGR